MSFWPPARLRVTLGYLNRGYPEIMPKFRPLFTRGRLCISIANDSIQIDQGALDKVGHEPRIGAVIDHGGI